MTKKARRFAFWTERLRELTTRWGGLPRETDSWLGDPENLHKWRTTYRRIQCLQRWGPKKRRKAFRETLHTGGLRDLMQRSSGIRDHQVAAGRLRDWAPEAPMPIDPLVDFVETCSARMLETWIADWLALQDRQPLAEWTAGELENHLPNEEEQTQPKPDQSDAAKTDEAAEAAGAINEAGLASGDAESGDSESGDSESPDSESGDSESPVTRSLRRRLRRDFKSLWNDWQDQLETIHRQPLAQWDVDQVHRLRIDGKRLRYLGEWWRSHLTGRQQHQLDQLDSFHQAAGRLQDAVSMGDLLTALRTEESLPPEAIQAAIWAMGRATGDLAEQRVRLAWTIDQLLRGRGNPPASLGAGA